MQQTLNSDLAHAVRRECGENAYLCYQCQKCSSGCPVSAYFDLAPNQLMRAVQFGQKDLVLKSKTLWLCAMCETCAVRCPHDINITRIMDVLKSMALKEGLSSPLPSAVVFNQAALRGVRWFGRMYEAGLMGEIYMRKMAARTLDYMQLIRWDLPLAWKMIRNGRLKILPSFGKTGHAGVSEERKEEIAYYPGCSLHGTSQEYDTSTRAVFNKLGVTFAEPKEWICCGSTPAHSTDHYLSVLLPVKNLLSIWKKGYRRITTPCPSCFLRLRYGMKECEDQVMISRLKKDLRELPGPDMEIDHTLKTISDTVMSKKIAQKIVRPLQGLRVVCYYGCIITRPPKITGIEDYEYPMHMDRLLKLLGAEPLDWSYKTACCGGSLGISQLPLALELTGKILRDAKSVGAEAIVVACPLCQVNLDARQRQISEEADVDFNLPVVYFTQLMGMALGSNGEELGLDKHFVDTAGIVKRIEGGQRAAIS